MSTDNDDNVSLGPQESDAVNEPSENMDTSSGMDEEDESSESDSSSSEHDASVDGSASSSDKEVEDSSQESSEANSVSRDNSSSAVSEGDVPVHSDTTSDESYRPPSRRSHRLARVLSFTSGRPSEDKSVPPGNAQAPSDRELRYRAQRDLARNEVCLLRDKTMAQQLQYEDQIRDLQDQLTNQSEQLRALQGKSKAAAIKLLNRPSQFDGSNKTKVVDWLLAMKQWLTAAEADQSDHVSTAESYLRDEAMRYWLKRKQLLSEEQQKSWAAFHEALLERFDAENTSESARIKLDHLEQGGMSMAKFVSQFDQISSYIDDMSDKDLIHRFLEAVRPEHRPILRNNPSEGGPWHVYAQLRKYALNMFPDDTHRKGKSSHTTLVGSGRNTNKRKFSVAAAAEAAEATWEVARQYKKARNANQQQGSGQQQGGSERWIEFSNAAGQTVKRTAAQRNAVFKARLCGFCYRSGHSSGECRAKQPARGDPPSTSSGK